MFARLLGIAGIAGTALIGASAAGAQGTGSTAGHGSHGAHAAPSTQAAQTMQQGHAMLIAPSGARSPAGMVMVHGTAVELTLTGDQAGAIRPWYIHKGSCKDDQGVVGDASKFTPVSVGTDGKGMARATLAAPLAGGTTYFVAVHASASDMTTIVACGPIAEGMM